VVIEPEFTELKEPEAVAPLTSNEMPLINCPAEVGFAKRSVSKIFTVLAETVKSAEALTGPSPVTADTGIGVAFVLRASVKLREQSAVRTVVFGVNVFMVKTFLAILVPRPSKATMSTA
jgi:hypothetical protein